MLFISFYVPIVQQIIWSMFLHHILEYFSMFGSWQWLALEMFFCFYFHHDFYFAFESSDFAIGLGDTAVPISFVFVCLGMLTFRRLLVIMTLDCSWVADGHFPTLGFLFFGLSHPQYCCLFHILSNWCIVRCYIVLVVSVFSSVLVSACTLLFF